MTTDPMMTSTCVVVSNAVTNGNPVYGLSNMEAPGGCVKGCVQGVCEDVSVVCPA